MLQAVTNIATSAITSMTTTRVMTAMTPSLAFHDMIPSLFRHYMIPLPVLTPRLVRLCSVGTQGVLCHLHEAVRAHGASLARRASRVRGGGCRRGVRAEVAGQESWDAAGRSHH